MLYATPPVFGATTGRANWIGLPVQWVGGVYAYSLTTLALYDPRSIGSAWPGAF